MNRILTYKCNHPRPDIFHLVAFIEGRSIEEACSIYEKVYGVPVRELELVNAEMLKELHKKRGSALTKEYIDYLKAPINNILSSKMEK